MTAFKIKGGKWRIIHSSSKIKPHQRASPGSKSCMKKRWPTCLKNSKTPEEKAKLTRLHSVVSIFIELQGGAIGVVELDQIKANFQAAEIAKKDPYKSIDADLQAATAAFTATQRKPSNASGITQDGAGAPNFDGEDPELDGDSGQGPVSRFMKRFRKKPLNEVLHGHWPGYNPNGIAIS